MSNDTMEYAARAAPGGAPPMGTRPVRRRRGLAGAPAARRPGGLRSACADDQRANLRRPRMAAAQPGRKIAALGTCRFGEPAASAMDGGNLLAHGMPCFANVIDFVSQEPAQPVRRVDLDPRAPAEVHELGHGREIRQRWKKPFILKGILSPEGVRRSVASGVDGVAHQQPRRTAARLGDCTARSAAGCAGDRWRRHRAVSVRRDSAAGPICSRSWYLVRMPCGQAARRSMALRRWGLTAPIVPWRSSPTRR